MKKWLTILIIMLISALAEAQQQVMFTQYMFNGLTLNPAYAGIHDGLSTNFMWREQWVGFDGAPSTQTLALHSPLGSSPMSLGGLIIRDKIGVTEQIGTYGSGAFRILFSNEARLSFGLQASATNFRADYIDTTTGSDPTLSNAAANEFLINFGAGLLYHSDRMYVGLSIPHILEQQIDGSNPESEAVYKRHYFMTGGVVFDLNTNFKLKPNVLLKYVSGAPVQLDLNANLLIRDIVWAGVSYRSLESVDLLLQLQLTPRLQLGYAYDISTTSELSSVNAGSHEFMLNYVFKLSNSKSISPRYF